MGLPKIVRRTKLERRAGVSHFGLMPQDLMRKHKSRIAFTLLEVLLVLAIIAVAAAMALPTFDSLITSRRVKNNTERIALELAEARLSAIRTGQAQVFTAALNGNQYTISPWLDGYDEVNASAGATIQSSLTGQTIDTGSNGTSTSDSSNEGTPLSLESGVQFYAVDTLLDTRNAAAIQTKTGVLPSAASGSTDGESNPILFYPDGSSTTAKVQLIDDRGRRMIIEIRGLTGRISFYRATGVDPSAFTSSPSVMGGAQ